MSQNLVAVISVRKMGRYISDSKIYAKAYQDEMQIGAGDTNRTCEAWNLRSKKGEIMTKHIVKEIRSMQSAVIFSQQRCMTKRQAGRRNMQAGRPLDYAR